jgi:hypothetical protein
VTAVLVILRAILARTLLPHRREKSKIGFKRQALMNMVDRLANLAEARLFAANSTRHWLNIAHISASYGGFSRGAILICASLDCTDSGSATCEDNSSQTLFTTGIKGTLGMTRDFCQDVNQNCPPTCDNGQVKPFCCEKEIPYEHCEWHGSPPLCELHCSKLPPMVFDHHPRPRQRLPTRPDPTDDGHPGRC